MLPLLHLAHRLSLHGLTITIVITPKNLTYLSSLLSSHPSSITSLILFSLLTLPSLPESKTSKTSATLVELSALPGSHVFKSNHLPSLFRLYKKSDPDWEFIKDLKLANTKNWGCVFNSFDAFEGEYMDYLKKKLSHDWIFGVGPLNLPSPENLGSESDLNERLLTWLDECPKASVVYVWFGSQKLLKREQMEALALGLEKSGTRFVWVVKTGSTQAREDEFENVPDGFEEQVASRGLVIREWAPQVSILNHEAVGGFLSHCGWNSVLEGIVGGVVILA
ncbi:hypothetical protein PVK06_044778 [Gossypium arboreum]|uniref:UDP-glycosyltransferase 89A2-like n=1 Tax=Gossypium arboreum TaxID=29729 RepID=A0ABR0MS68_GOSAR|nr:hypothetical protein PVK06_044778 [Gossypium arboreum]